VQVFLLQRVRLLAAAAGLVGVVAQGEEEYLLPAAQVEAVECSLMVHQKHRS
jgi:hypothetical protein